MESISPTLRLVLHIRASLEAGSSVREAIQYYIKEAQNELGQRTFEWLMRRDQGRANPGTLDIVQNPYRHALFECFDRGLRGESILNQLQSLEAELIAACNEEIELEVSLLPLKALIPLLLLQFPALLLLFLGPILNQLTQSL